VALFTRYHLQQPIVAQLVGVILLLVADHDAVHPLDDELWQVVDYIRVVAIIAEAINEAFGKPEAMVELARGSQAGVRGNLTSLEIHADTAVMTEGECCLDVALCTHDTSLWK